MKTIVNRLKLTIILSLFALKAFSSVHGPVYIDILGIDTNINVIYFVETDWSECDCDPVLYKYHIDNDSLVQINNWVNRASYARKDNRKQVIKNKGLDKLFLIDSIDSFKHEFYKFSWQPPVMMYNYALMEDAPNYPFRLQFGERYFEYILCFNKESALQLTKYEINDNFGFLFCRYKGECREGNTIDKVIIFKTVGKEILSRELNTNDKLKSKN